MSRSEDSEGTTWSGSPTGGQAPQNDCHACRNGIHGQCITTDCGCRQRATESHRVLALFEERHPTIGMDEIAKEMQQQMLNAVTAKEGKRLTRPVMCRVVVEAWTEDQ